MLWHSASALLLVVSCKVLLASSVFRSDEGELTSWLISRCDLHSGYRPVTYYGDALHVTMGVIILNFFSVQEAETTVNFIGGVQLTYMHPCVSWGSDNETTQWENIQRLVRYDDRDIFRPQLWIVNSASSMMLSNAGDDQTTFTTITIYRDGRIVSDIQKFFQIKCNINYRRFPFDKSICSVKFEAGLSTDLLVIELAKENDGGFVFSENSADLEMWSFHKLRAHHYDHTYTAVSTPVNYSSLLFDFELRRKPSFHMMTSICPCIVLQVLQLSAAFMPPKMPDRPSYSMSVMLALNVLQTSVTDEIPRTSQTVIFIVNLCVQVILGMFCIIYSLLSCALAREEWFCKTVQFKAQCNKDNVISISRIRLLDVVFFGAITLAAIITNIWAFSEICNENY